MLDDYPRDFREALVKGVRKATYFAEAQAKKSFGKSGHLKSRSGHLRRSIKSRVKEMSKNIIGELSSDVIYAAIHEYGGIIRAKNAPYLKFKIGNRWVQVKKVFIPPRPYLRPAFEDNLRKMETIITDTVAKELN